MCRKANLKGSIHVQGLHLILTDHLHDVFDMQKQLWNRLEHDVSSAVGRQKPSTC